METQSNIDANSHTLRLCVKAFTAVSNLSRQLQSKTSEVQRMSAQLSLFQRMYQDTRQEISQLKRQNKELKHRTTNMKRSLML
ncbi:hypothetical protein ACSBR1_009081 [Camellia fascicularis]